MGITVILGAWESKGKETVFVFIGFKGPSEAYLEPLCGGDYKPLVVSDQSQFTLPLNRHTVQSVVCNILNYIILKEVA